MNKTLLQILLEEAKYDTVLFVDGADELNEDME